MSNKILSRNGHYYKHVPDFPGIYQETSKYGTMDKKIYIIRVYSKVYNKNTYITKDDQNKPFTNLKATVTYQSKYWSELNGVSKDKITVKMLWETEISKHIAYRAPKTITRYKSLFEHHILPNFGDYSLTKTGKYGLTISKINIYLATLYHYQPKNLGNKKSERGNVNIGNGYKVIDARIPYDGYSYEYVIGILKCFVLLYNVAFESGYIDSTKLQDFRSGVKLRDELGAGRKSKDKLKIRILSSEQIHAINDLLKDTDFYLPFLISLNCGLRPGEAFGVSFDSIDYVSGTLKVEKQFFEATPILDSPRAEDQAKYHFQTPKLGMTRVVPVSKSLLVLLKHKENELKKVKDERKVIRHNIAIYDHTETNVNKRVKYSAHLNLITEDLSGKIHHLSSFQYYAKIIRNGDDNHEPICPNIPGMEDFSFYTFRKTFLSRLAATAQVAPAALLSIAGHKKIERLYDSYYSSPEEAIVAASKAQKSIFESDNLLNTKDYKEENKWLNKIRNYVDDDLEPFYPFEYPKEIYIRRPSIDDWEELKF